MKRFLVFIFVVLAIASLLIFDKGNLSEIKFDYNYSNIIYLNHKNFQNSEIQKIENGNGLILKTNNIETVNILKQIEGVVGEAIEFRVSNSVKTKDLLKYLINKLRLTTYDTKDINDSFVISAYSPLLSHYIWVNGVRQNIQISLNNSVVIVGYPLILHSF